MPQVNIFRWRPGNGWLILAGGGTPDSEDNLNIDARMLSRTVSQGPLAYVWAAGDIEAADRHMDSLRDLGARTGYLVDILAEEDDVLFRQLSEAGLIIVADGPHRDALRAALVGVALHGIEDAFRRGATLAVIGHSAALFGAHVAERDGVSDGFGWLSHALIMPAFVPDHADHLRALVSQVPAAYGLGLGEGAALAFGPQGEVEVWGNAAITVSLGRSYNPDIR